MNCLEFRQRLLTAPRASTSAMAAHRTECARCAGFANRVEQMESALTEAVCVTVPEGLAHRILLRRSLADRPPVVAPARRQFLALAASVAVATTGLGALLFWRRGQQPTFDDSLARELVMHLLMKHPPGLGAKTQVSESEVSGLLRRAGFAARASLGRVANAWPCVFRDQPIAHLVLPGNDGPVTALVLPFPATSQSHHFAGPDISGVVAPCAHGTLALLTASDIDPGAESDARLDELAARLQGTIVSA